MIEKHVMPEEIKERLFKIRLKSKLFGVLSEEDQKFCAQCYEKFPEEYALMSKNVHEAAYEHVNPFNAKR